MMITLPRFMMATTAMHLTGELSREDDGKDNIAILGEYDPETNEYIGNWVYGYGLINVRYPADTVRELTDEEYAHFDGTTYSINSTVYDTDFGASIRRTNGKDA